MKEFEQDELEQDSLHEDCQLDTEPIENIPEPSESEVEQTVEEEPAEQAPEQPAEQTAENESGEPIEEAEVEAESENVSDAYFKQLLSLQAEFDNYRKRTQADVSKAYQNGFNEAITEFLPALDSFKMATDMITDQNTLIGIQYIEKGILAVLEKMGISVIDTTGEFDPNVHQAIGTEADTEVPSGHIVKECFKGFKMGDKVIRYAQVIVAK